MLLSIYRLMNDTVLEVYSLNADGHTANLEGEVNKFTSLIWKECFNGYEEFELWVPITEENKSLLTEGRIIYPKGRDSCAFIEKVSTKADSDGALSFDISGRTASKLLTHRIVWGLKSASNIDCRVLAMALVNENMKNPTNNDRKVPYFRGAESCDNLTATTISNYQKTGGEVYDAVYELGNTYGFGMLMKFEPSVSDPFVLHLPATHDKTETSNTPIVFHASLEDIVESIYERDTKSLKNVALVAGEGEGSDRVFTTVGNVSGWNRRELWVDARDLQSEEETTQQAYIGQLQQRGSEKLSENKTLESFEASLRVYGGIQYSFGEDYYLGDYVTIVDERIGVKVDALITGFEVDVSSDNGSSLLLTFGYGQPSLLQAIKRKLM